MSTTPSALAQAVQAAPILESVAADLKRNTWTFANTAHAPVSAGHYVVLPAAIATNAIAQDAEREAGRMRLAFAEPGEIESVNFCTIGGDRALEVTRAGFKVTVYCDRLPDQERSRYSDPRHPSYWYGSMERVDEEGGEWRRTFGYLVQDDFGTLVAVGGAA